MFLELLSMHNLLFLVESIKLTCFYSALSPPEGRWLRYRELSCYIKAKLGEVMSEKFISMGVAYRHFSIVTGKSVRRKEIRVMELHRGTHNVSRIRTRNVPNRLFAANESKPWVHLYGHQQFIGPDVVRR